MKTTRREFLTTATIGGLASTTIPFALRNGVSTEPTNIEERFAKLDEILTKPVLKKELFTTPVLIESVELLHYNNRYLCRVRSTDGAEGISAAHFDMHMFYPILLRRIKPFFIGQDARDLDLILERILVYRINYRMGGIALGIPLATVEFAILDMLGRIADKSMGELLGDIHNPEINLYIATEFRHLPLEDHFESIKDTVARFDVNALKMKVGYRYFNTKELNYGGYPGKTEKLVPLLRKYYGDEFHLYSDANGFYDVQEAITIGRLLQENRYRYFEEPVPFDHFEDIKKVTDALDIPIANGEQDHSFYNFRWFLAHECLDIFQPDNYYFGGMIRSVKVARMAEAFGKVFIPHMSGGGLGYVYNAHIVSVCPNAGPHHEFKGFDTHIPFECPTSPLNLVNGKMKVPTGPGSGIEIDPDFLEKHQTVSIN